MVSSCKVPGRSFLCTEPELIWPARCLPACLLALLPRTHKDKEGKYVTSSAGRRFERVPSGMEGVLSCRFSTRSTSVRCRRVPERKVQVSNPGTVMMVRARLVRYSTVNSTVRRNPAAGTRTVLCCTVLCCAVWWCSQSVRAASQPAVVGGRRPDPQPAFDY